MKCPRCGKHDIRQEVNIRWQVVKDSFICKDCNLHGNEALFCEDTDKGGQQEDDQGDLP